MLQTTVIGHLGADAECKNANGKEFITFRVANTDKWTDEAGQTHETTTWVDCILSGKPKVFDFLKKGQLIYATGSVALRVYSSPKEKCMKAGLTINVNRIELLGGRSDDIPSVLFTEDGREQIHVAKYFYAPVAVDEEGNSKSRVLCSKSGERYVQDVQGWVTREVAQPE